ncbi:site-specific DNA-methyltransferase [Actinomadura sp. NEAU-AAG5]|uniref:Methyltransferase n=2 Tax=Actinomadura litoris TaxID=2678616 RepID=A0A7K1LAK7_9ACTN|nr:site-specific DNA-methyltransferase [Actinomadura litoris]
MREVLPALGITADLIVADPPYAETSLAWDRWPDGWPALAATASSSMWCFGSMRMLLHRRDEFADWQLSQDVVWEKTAGSSPATDRFKRVHEIATHWYRGEWRGVHHATPRHVPPGGARSHTQPGEKVAKRGPRAEHLGVYGTGTWVDDGTRYMTSVIACKNLRGFAIHPTEKPVGILRPLIEYGCPPGGLVVDPFAGSGSTLDAARLIGRRAIGVEWHEPYVEAAARRLAQAPLELA